MTTNEDVKQAMREVDAPVVSPGYLAEHVEVGRERCRQRLKDLSKQGQIKEDKLVQMSIYWLD